jgi:hypothetical protein
LLSFSLRESCAECPRSVKSSDEHAANTSTIGGEKIPANTEIPDQHYVPMRLRDWIAPVTIIALEAWIFP